LLRVQETVGLGRATLSVRSRRTELGSALGTKHGVVHFGYDPTLNEGKPMKATIIAAGMFLVVGAQASFAQTARDATSEGQATITEEQKLGPNAGTSQVGNERITTGTPGATQAPLGTPRVEKKEVAPAGRR
jgi:hypothetical protein